MKIEVNDITLNYNKEGNGPALILLHGNGEDHHIFDKLVPKLKDDFTIYAIDSRNHGESSKTVEYDYESMANDIYQFIEKLNLKEISLVGFSDGAIIGLYHSMRKNDLIRRMVLLGVNLKPSDFKQEVYDYIAKEYEQTKDPLLKMMLEQPNIEISDLKSISTPTLIVAAENDLYDPQLFRKIVDIMPDAKLLVMNGHDHGSYIIDEDILYPYLKSFLN